MAELFGIDKSGISRHLTKIFETSELKKEVVVAKIATTTQHGAVEEKTQPKDTNYYNLDAIISVGYRINFIKATQFRIWATNILKEYMIKRFAMDDKRLKLAKTAFGKDYYRKFEREMYFEHGYKNASMRHIYYMCPWNCVLIKRECPCEKTFPLPIIVHNPTTVSSF